ncbi:hypothetical protein [Pseudobacteriovorax antillogorgiicola]|uniref:Uncharacterized protein n=1 Tax=Pseudobacteriovorax antillogorgiicola TaxID=1513793 RepID=A0A1Y6BNZ1_9BACT|nr:hypothetical protein [Pseudobacteriovorax antillogorgiicola]TCS55568.1 hypothetical protein EDD56_105294 [Pseudobacteriovorax antillogorgiicola]SMF10816.1 hypothetical protein SAMN06296036_10530 [Pseudobacteriovorax antillogorgiicola]
MRLFSILLWTLASGTCLANGETGVLISAQSVPSNVPVPFQVEDHSSFEVCEDDYDLALDLLIYKESKVFLALDEKIHLPVDLDEVELTAHGIAIRPITCELP